MEAPEKRPMGSKKLVRFRPEDMLFLSFALVLSVLYLSYGIAFKVAWVTFTRLLLGLSILCIVSIAYALKERKAVGRNKGKAVHNFFKAFRDWLPFVVVTVCYQYIQPLVTVVRPETIDNELMRADRLLFGTDPVLFLQKTYNPVLTDYLAFCYSLYFFLPFIPLLLLYFKGREREYRLFMLAMVSSFYIGFLGYIFFPAVGPRNTIPGEFTRELEGVFLWGPVKDAWNYMESINRDCFPSLHTAQSAIPLYFAYRCRGMIGKGRVAFWVMLPLVVSIWFSTVYLRYHWVVDVIAGLVLAALTVILAGALDRAFSRPDTEGAGKSS